MSSITSPKLATGKNTSGRLAKAITLLVISLGPLWFSGNFPFYHIFEPQSTGWVLWLSYAKDLIQPFAFFFFLCLGERWLKTWRGRALIAFAIPALLEIGQGLYYQFSPSRYVGSFDPMDIIMYAVGVGLAVVLEQMVFARKLKFWQ